MGNGRKQYSAEYKFQVALAAARNDKTVSQLASEYGVHPTQINEWKRQLMKEGSQVFGQRTTGDEAAAKERENELYEQIGRLKMELEWVKKKAAGISR
jgi:transposase-like protein